MITTFHVLSVRGERVYDSHNSERLALLDVQELVRRGEPVTIWKTTRLSPVQPNAHVQPPAKPKAPRRPRFVPPTLEEVAAYIAERKSPVDPEQFHAHYAANGWVQGKGKPIANWRACVVTWEKNAGKFDGRNGQNQTKLIDMYEEI